MFHSHKLLCKLAKFTQINIWSKLLFPRLIIYRNQAVTPPGRWLRHDNASQTSRLRRIPKEVETVIKSGTQSRQHGSRLQRHRQSGTTISNPGQTQVRANGMQWFKPMSPHPPLHSPSGSSADSWEGHLHFLWNQVLLVRLRRRRNIFQNKAWIIAVAARRVYFSRMCTVTVSHLSSCSGLRGDRTMHPGRQDLALESHPEFLV